MRIYQCHKRVQSQVQVFSPPLEYLWQNLGTMEFQKDIIKYAMGGNQIKPILLMGNMQREKLSVSCRVCKRYHLLGWCSLPADGVPQGKWWWKTQTSCIHPSIILLISTSPRHKYSIRVQVEDTQNFKEGGGTNMCALVTGFCVSGEVNIISRK